MVTELDSEKSVLRDLGDGLVVRRAVPADKDALVELNAGIFREPSDAPNAEIAAWTRDLMKGTHPTVGPDDILVVEDTHARRLVSTVSVISQVWSYDGIEFGVGRPELVATLPEYRNKGLVRAQFEQFHKWSAERGEWVQAITGIPYYYRRFGYEMALSLDGGRTGYKVHVPRLNEGMSEPFNIRPATLADIPFLSGLYNTRYSRSMVSAVRDEKLWRYDLEGREEASVCRRVFLVIETPEGNPVGFIAHPSKLWGSALVCLEYELTNGILWAAATPSVVRYLAKTGESYWERDGRKGSAFGEFSFMLGLEHPVYHAFSSNLPHTFDPYAWYIRVANLAGFLRLISPVLEQRLAGSVLAGYTGDLKLNLYQVGLTLKLEKGRIADIVHWKPSSEERGHAAFPDLTFLHLLFGHRDLTDLRYAFPDCRVTSDVVRELLSILFPKRPSQVWPVA